MPPKKRHTVNLKSGKKKLQTQQQKASDEVVPDDSVPSHDEPAARAEKLGTGGHSGVDEHNGSHDVHLEHPPGGEDTTSSILEHLRTQDDHINRLSNTVDELRKTMN